MKTYLYLFTFAFLFSANTFSQVCQSDNIALKFDGKEDYLFFKGIEASGDFSIGFWVEQVAINSNPIQIFLSFGPDNSLMIGLDGDGNLFVQDQLAGFGESFDRLENKKCSHIGFVAEGSNRHIYLNFEPIRTYQTNSSIYGPDLAIGSWVEANNVPTFYGSSFDHFRGYSLALSPSKFCSEMNSNSTGGDLQLFYDFKEGTPSGNNSNIDRPTNKGLLIDPGRFVGFDLVGGDSNYSCFSKEISDDLCVADPCTPDLTPPICRTRKATIELNENGIAFLKPENIDAGSSDECDDVTLSVSQEEFSCANLGESISFTLTVTDAVGNTSTCQDTVLVVDNIDPVCTSIPTTLDIGPSGTLTIDESDLNIDATDNCGVDKINLGRNTFTCDDENGVVIEVRVTDFSGNISFCAAEINFEACDPCLEDTVDPICSAMSGVTTVLDANGNAEISVQEVNFKSFDECSDVEFTLNNSTFTCQDVGQDISVVLTVTDESGNSSTCSSLVNVIDNIDPLCTSSPTTLTIGQSGSLTIDANDLNIQASDNCGVNRIELSRSTFTCNDEGELELVATVFDFSGNKVECSLTVFIIGCDPCLEDTVDPICSSMDGVQAILDANGNAAISVQEVNFKSFDECSDVQFSLNNSTFTCQDLGQDISVVLTVTDESGNASTCSSLVNVIDNIDPICTSSPTTLTIGQSGTLTIDANDLNIQATDNCTVSRIELSRTTFTCADEGGAVIMVTVTDGGGLAVQCPATLFFQGCEADPCNPDETPPLCSIQNVPTFYVNENGEVEIDANDVDFGSFDGCSAVDLTIEETNYTCADINADVSARLTVTDQAGNSSVCFTSVIIADTIAPTCTALPTTLTIGPSGTLTITENDLNIQASDNCTVNQIELSRTTFTCEDEDGTVIMVTVVDGGGLSVQCPATLFFEGCVVDPCMPDETPPICSIQNLPTFYIDENGEVEITANAVDFGSFDECSAVALSILETNYTCTDVNADVSARLTVTDQAGNSSVCFTSVIIADTIAPTCTAFPTTLTIGPSGTLTIDALDLNIQAFDNCGVNRVELSRNTFTCDDENGLSIIATVFDASQNLVECSITLFFENCEVDPCDLDIIPPVCTVPDITVSLNESGFVELDPDILIDFVDDNCAIDNVQILRSEFNCNDVVVPFANTLTVCDTSNNCTDCDFQVTVIDTLNPVCFFDDVSIEAVNLGNDFLDFNDFVEDNCGINEVIFVPAINEELACGVHVIQAIVADFSDNQTVCSFELEVTNCGDCCLLRNEFNQTVDEEFILNSNFVFDNCEVTLNLPNLTECQFITNADWGDGTTSQFQITSPNSISHIYTDPGPYEICMTFSELSFDSACFEQVKCETVTISDDCVLTRAPNSETRDVLNVFPNPARNFITIEIDSDTNTTIESISLFDSKGSIVLERDEIENRRYFLSNLDLSSGVYLVRITSSTGRVLIKKLIIV